MRTKTTSEEKELKKAEKEKEAQAKLKEFKDNKYLEKIPDDILIKFIQRIDKDYPEVDYQKAVNQLFKNCASGKFNFTVKIDIE